MTLVARNDDVLLRPMNTASQFRRFVPNNDGEQRCLVKTSGGEEISIVVRPNESSTLHVSVKKRDEWKAIAQSNLPAELQDGFSNALKKLVEMAVFTVVTISRDDYRLELKMSGGMAQIAEKRLLEQQLFQNLIPAIDTKLSVAMNHFALTPAGQFLEDILPLGSLVFVSLAASGTGIAMMATAGTLLAGPTFGVSAVLTVIFCIGVGVSVYLKDKRQLAEHVRGLIQNGQDCFLQASQAYVNQDESRIVDVVNTFMRQLIKHKFVKVFSPRLFELNESTFKDMASLYPREEGKSVCAMMKLLILFSAELLPLKACPSAAILECLEEVDVDSVPENIRDYVYIAMGRLNINRGDKEAAKENFERINETSDQYPFAKEYLEVLEQVEQQSGLLN